MTLTDDDAALLAEQLRDLHHRVRACEPVDLTSPRLREALTIARRVLGRERPESRKTVSDG